MTLSAVSGASGGMPPQGVDPDQYAQQYATQNGISLEQAKAELKAKYGDPQQVSAGGGNLSLSTNSVWTVANNSSTSKADGAVPNLPPEAMQLQSLGIPVDVIIQGDNAIMKFAQENNIELPEKTSGAKLNFDS